jgi:COP9 signalosome complex subunit 4
MLYKSDRTRELVGLYSILTKVYLDRVLSPEDVALFNEHLSEHHHTTLADGSTVLDQAVLQHNVLSISRLYDYIKVSELARLLDVSESRAEAIAARMIGESRIHGSIDQVARLIAFERAPLVEPTRETADPTTGANAGRGNTTLEPSSARVLTRWDERLQTLCAHVEQMVEEIVEKHPDWAKQRASQCV